MRFVSVIFSLYQEVLYELSETKDFFMFIFMSFYEFLINKKFC